MQRYRSWENEARQYVDRVEAENRDLRAKSQEVESRIANIQSSAEARIAEVSKQMEDVLGIEKTQAHEAARLADQELRNKQAEIVRLQVGVDALAAENEQLRQQRNATETEYGRKQDENQQKIAQLEHGLETAESGLREALQTALKEGDVFNHVQRSLALERQRTAGLEENMATLNRRYDEARRELESARRSLAHDLGQRHHVSNEYQAVKTHLQGIIRGQADRIQQLSASIVALRQEVDASSREIAARETQLRNVIASLLQSDVSASERGVMVNDLKQQLATTTAVKQRYESEMQKIVGQKASLEESFHDLMATAEAAERERTGQLQGLQAQVQQQTEMGERLQEESARIQHISTELTAVYEAYKSSNPPFGALQTAHGRLKDYWSIAQQYLDAVNTYSTALAAGPSGISPEERSTHENKIAQLSEQFNRARETYLQDYQRARGTSGGSIQATTAGGVATPAR